MVQGHYFRSPSRIPIDLCEAIPMHKKNIIKYVNDDYIFY